MALPPACSDCITTLQLAQPGAAPQVTPWQLLRARDGRTRMNFGDISIINNPAAGLRIVLDHVLKQARTMPMPAGGGGMPGMPGFQMPGLPGGPAAAPGMNVVQLGKAFMQGQQVEGQRYTFGPASMAEVWTSTKLRLPVLTTFTGDFGQQTCRCTPLGVEPNPSAFQIPPGYRSMISG